MSLQKLSLTFRCCCFAKWRRYAKMHTHTHTHTHIDANSARWLTGLYSYVANLVAISHCFSFVVVAFYLPLFVAFSCDFIFCSLSVFFSLHCTILHTHTHTRALTVTLHCTNLHFGLQHLVAVARCCTAKIYALMHVIVYVYVCTCLK